MPTKDVNKLLKGVNDCILAAVDDAGAASPAQCGDTFPLLSCGFLDENAIQSESKKLTQKAHGGEQLQLGEVATVNVTSLSGAGIGITAAKKFKNAQCNIYGFGSQQSHKLTRFLMNVETPHDMKKGGKSVIIFSTEKKVSPDETLGTLGSSVSAFSADAAYKFRDYINAIRQEGLVFAFLPYLGNFSQTAKAYDASDNRITGALTNGPAWAAAPLAGYSKLTFDGVNDFADFGNILVQNSTDDFMIEAWVRILAADGALVPILGNKTSNGNTTAGWSIYRSSSNQLVFNLGDGSAQASPGGGSVLQNVWNHLAVAVDRNGNAVLFVNGVQVQSSSVASIVDSSTTNTFYIGRSPSGSYGNIETAAVRHYKYAAGGLPSDYAAMFASHYNSEKAILGL
jgi:hypothetical protein